MDDILITVYGYNYTVKFVSPEELKEELKDDTDNTVGSCLPTKQLILISKELHHEKILPVFIHEVTHAIAYESGFTISDEEGLAVFAEVHLKELIRLRDFFIKKQKGVPVCARY